MASKMSNDELTDSGIAFDLDAMHIDEEKELEGRLGLIPTTVVDVLAASRVDDDVECSSPSLVLTSASRSSATFSLFTPDEEGDTQLHLAVASNCVQVVEALCRLCPHPRLLSLANTQALYTPLHLAVLQNLPHLVRVLVDAGGEVDVVDHEGNTPLHLAAARGHVECAQGLLHQPQSPVHDGLHSLHVDQAVGLFNHSGLLPIHLAVMANNVHLLRLIARHHPEGVRVGEGRGGRACLHLAAAAGHLQLVRVLVQELHCSLLQQDWSHRTPFHVALANHKLDVANFLIHNTNCDLNLDDPNLWEDIKARLIDGNA